MKLWIFSVCHNESAIAPFYLRHYEPIADRICIWDDCSTDGTREIIKASKAELHEWPLATGLYEDVNLEFAYNRIETMARGNCDWVAWVDMDEFLYAPKMREGLDLAMQAGIEVIQTSGFNLIGDSFPKDDGRQIYEINPMGVRAPIYAKPVVFRPEVHVRWQRGKHALENCSPVLSLKPQIKLIHARYFGAEFTRLKNAKNYGRCGLLNGDKGPAWSCHPDYKGEGSPEWVEFAKTVTFNVLEAPL